LYWSNNFGYPYSLLRQQINQAKKSGRNIKEVVDLMKFVSRKEEEELLVKDNKINLLNEKELQRMLHATKNFIVRTIFNNM